MILKLGKTERVNIAFIILIVTSFFIGIKSIFCVFISDQTKQCQVQFEQFMSLKITVIFYVYYKTHIIFIFWLTIV